MVQLTLDVQEITLDMLSSFNRPQGISVNKGTFGHVLVIAGSVNYSGAAILTAHGALRGGAGLVTLALPSDCHALVAPRLSPEIIAVRLKGDGETMFAECHLEEMLKLTEKKQVVAIGPGIGTHESTGRTLLDFLKQCAVPAVIDADGINLISMSVDGGKEILNSMSSPSVLTPHPGELSRLIHWSIEKINSNRVEAVRFAADKFRSVVVLKGHQTLVCTPDGKVYLNTTGNSALATAGSGDVLTGIIAARRAQGISSLAAALEGVYVHGSSADFLVEQLKNNLGIVASDIVAALPQTFALLNAK